MAGIGDDWHSLEWRVGVSSLLILLLMLLLLLLAQIRLVILDLDHRRYPCSPRGIPAYMLVRLLIGR